MKKLMLALSFGALFVVASCKTTAGVASLSIEKLTDTTWELTEINGKPVSGADFGNGAPTATFSTDNRISGKGGCNTYTGSYNLNEDGGMNISQMVSTKMFCQNANGETAYFKALESVTAAKIDKDKLTLMKGVDAVLVFKPAAQ